MLESITHILNYNGHNNFNKRACELHSQDACMYKMPTNQKHYPQLKTKFLVPSLLITHYNNNDL